MKCQAIVVSFVVVIPLKKGIQSILYKPWNPASAGMTNF